MTWTDARIAELARLWAAGVSAAGIAEALGEVSRSAVLGKLHRLRLLRSRKPASPPRRYDGPAVAPVAARPAILDAQVKRRPAPPEPPPSPWRAAAFEPLPASRPKPWFMRDVGECAFPVGGEGAALVSCCAPARERSAYCVDHHHVVFRALSPAARAAEARRWDKAAPGWSGTIDLEANDERTAA